jgi:hypothetical protein
VRVVSFEFSSVIREKAEEKMSAVSEHCSEITSGKRTDLKIVSVY